MTKLITTEVSQATTEGRIAVRSSDWLGRIYVIEGEWWVVAAANRTRLTLKLAESEWHAIRLNLGLAQRQLAQFLGISQSWLCKIEKGAVAAPAKLATRIRELRPNALGNGRAGIIGTSS